MLCCIEFYDEKITVNSWLTLYAYFKEERHFSIADEITFFDLTGLIIHYLGTLLLTVNICCE
jgi:hypothetical protein